MACVANLRKKQAGAPCRKAAGLLPLFLHAGQLRGAGMRFMGYVFVYQTFFPYFCTMIHLSHFFHASGAWRRWLVTAAMALYMAVQAAAADYGWAWIGAPHAEAGQHYWFRRSYTRLGHLQRATLRIATTGYAQVYVNGRNVCTDPVTPARHTPGTDPLACSYDVTAYVRDDSVTVAVWYAPAHTASATHGGGDAPQVALCLYGDDGQGHAVAVQTDGSWLCRPAPVRLNADGSQQQDGRQPAYDWAAGETEWALWQPATAQQLPHGMHTRTCSERCRVRRRLTATLQTKADGRLKAIFARPFMGLLRVTLRGAAPGQQLCVKPWLHYLCSGSMDEQACMRFTPVPLGAVVLEGDARFVPSQVQNVEGLEVTYYHDSY